MIELKLKTKDATSRIYIGSSLNKAASHFPGKSVIFIADENVLLNHRNSFPDYPIITIAPGEKSKSFNEVSRLYLKLLRLEADRSSAIVGVGGGITTDTSGFVASTFMRGIPFGFVATTLLAQVDAAIGGKNGINLEGYKNMVGVIRQPDFVICDLETLRTLDKKEIISGFAEVIKYGAIRNLPLFEYVEENIEDGLNMNMAVLEKIVTESARTKIEVVQRDEKEFNERKTLNFGHTFAHAFEKAYKISHGEAVAIGMLLAAKLSVNLKMLEASKELRIKDLIRRSKLPCNYKFDSGMISEIIKRDKKRAGRDIQFILLEDISKAVIKNIPVNDINSILNDLC